MAKAFEVNADMFRISTMSVPVEAANSMLIVEQYYSPLRNDFNIVKKEAPDMDDDDALQISVKAVNDSVGRDRLVPTLLVFGDIPRLGFPTDLPTPSTFKRSMALQKATDSMSRQFATRPLRDAMHP